MTGAEFNPDVPTDDETITGYILGDLPPDQMRSFEARMKDDGLLRVRVYETRRLIERLNTLPAEKANPGFTARVMQRLEPSEPATTPATPGRIIPFPWFRFTALAASLVILAGLIVVTANRLDATRSESSPVVREHLAARSPGAARLPGPDFPPAVSGGGKTSAPQGVATADLAWLEQVQLPDGSWDAAAWGGNWQARPGLTALVLCGLLRHGGGDNALTADANPVTRRALHFLMAYAAGSGPSERSTVVHRQQQLFVAAALHEARSVCRDETLAATIDTALDQLALPETGRPLTVASVMLPHLPEQAAAQGGRIYLIARALLLDT